MSIAGMVRFRGEAVTFTRIVQGSYDPTADTMTPATTTVSGYAMRVTTDPKQFAAGELVESKSPTIEFVPDTPGEVPAVGSSVTFGGSLFTVRAVSPVAQGGFTRRQRVVLAL